MLGSKHLIVHPQDVEEGHTIVPDGYDIGENISIACTDRMLNGF